jgi:hypothetical protein
VYAQQIHRRGFCWSILCNVVLCADLQVPYIIQGNGPHVLWVGSSRYASASHLTYALARLSPSRYSPFPRLSSPALHPPPISAPQPPARQPAWHTRIVSSARALVVAKLQSQEYTCNRRQSPAYTQVPCLQQISPHDRPVTHRTLSPKRSLRPELSSTTVRYLKIANSSKSASCWVHRGKGKGQWSTLCRPVGPQPAQR